MIVIAPKRRGQPRKEPSIVLSVRIPVSVYQAFKRVAHLHGFRTVSAPIVRFVTRASRNGATPD